MLTQICKWNNQLTINLPKDVTDQVCLAEGMDIEISVFDGKIIITPNVKKYTLSELLAGITPENIHDEVDTGFAVGNEIG
jgi:antitoxin MazE